MSPRPDRPTPDPVRGLGPCATAHATTSALSRRRMMPSSRAVNANASSASPSGITTSRARPLSLSQAYRDPCRVVQAGRSSGLRGSGRPRLVMAEKAPCSTPEKSAAVSGAPWRASQIPCAGRPLPPHAPHTESRRRDGMRVPIESVRAPTHAFTRSGRRPPLRLAPAPRPRSPAEGSRTSPRYGAGPTQEPMM